MKEEFRVKVMVKKVDITEDNRVEKEEDIGGTVKLEGTEEFCDTVRGLIKHGIGNVEMM